MPKGVNARTAALNDTDINTELITAIHGQALGDSAARLQRNPPSGLHEADLALIGSAARVCKAIQQQSRAACDDLAQAFRAEGIPCEPDVPEGPAAPGQLHRFGLRLRGRDPTRAVAVAERLGYRPPIEATGAGWAIYWRTNAQIVLTRQDEVGMRARIEWPLGRMGRAWPWRLRPGIGEVRGIGLAARWWPIAVVPVVARRLARRWRSSRGDEPQWGWMGTPPGLLDALFRFAELDGDDVLLDLGSGDGRVAIEAARRHGVRAIGVEVDAALCRTAVLAADSAGVADRVEIRCEPAVDAPIERASVVFLFLPIAAVTELIPELLRRLPAGSRIIAHEQAPAEFDPPPDRVAPLFGDAAVTVGHLWRVRG